MVHPLAVHIGAVEAAGIVYHECVADAAEHGMGTGYRRIVQQDVGAGVAPDRHLVLIEQVAGPGNGASGRDEQCGARCEPRDGFDVLLREGTVTCGGDGNLDGGQTNDGRLACTWNRICHKRYSTALAYVLSVDLRIWLMVIESEDVTLTVAPYFTFRLEPTPPAILTAF